MAGAWSDNQPDYSWLQPGEVKTFRHEWYPVRDLGAAKNANEDAAVNLEPRDRSLFLAFNTTTRHEGAQVELTAAGRPLLSRSIDIGPAEPYQVTPATAGGDRSAHVARRAIRQNRPRTDCLRAPTAPGFTHAEARGSDPLPPRRSGHR